MNKQESFNQFPLCPLSLAAKHFNISKVVFLHDCTILSFVFVIIFVFKALVSLFGLGLLVRARKEIR